MCAKAVEPSTIGRRPVVVALLLGSLVAGAYAWIDLEVDPDLRFVKYNLAAQQHVAGELPSVRRMDFSPLYFEWVSALVRFFPGEGFGIAATQWLHRVGTAVAIALFYLVLVGRRLSPAWAVAGALLLAALPHFAVYSRVFEPELLLLVALLGFVVALDRASLAGALVAGICAAAATGARPTFLGVFVLLGPGILALRFGWTRLAAVRSAAFLVPLLLCGIALGVRAHALVGDPFAPVMNPGTVFFEGNHPLSRGTSAAYPISVASLIELDPRIPDEAHNRYRKVARESLGRRVTTGDVNGFWAARALAFIADEPLRAASNVTGKLVRALRHDRFHDVGTAEKLEAELPIVPGLYGITVALAGVGLWLARGRWKEDLGLWVFAAAQLGVMTVFYVSVRQQMVLLPSLMYFAVIALAGFRQLEGRGRWIAAGVALALLAMTFTRDDTARDHRHRVRGGTLADRAAEHVVERDAGTPLSGKPEEMARVLAAAPWFARDNLPGNLDREVSSPFADAAALLRADPPKDFFGRFDLAVLELEAGEIERARARFEALAATGRRAYRTYTQPSDPAFYLGRIAARQGDREEAARWLALALERTPGDPWVLAEQAVLGFGEAPRARLERYYSPLDADLLIAEASLWQGRGERAVEVFSRHRRNVRRSHRANVGYAAALGATGQFERGVEVYRASLERASTPLLHSDEISALYRGWAAERPGDLEVALEAAAVLGFHGRFREAVRLLEPFAAQDDRADDALARWRLRIQESERARAAAR